MSENPSNTDVNGSGIDDSALTGDWYRTLFDHTGTAIVVLNNDMSVFSANIEFKRLCGIRRIENDSGIDFIEFVMPEDRERLRRYHIQRRKEGGKAPSEYEFNLDSGRSGRRSVSVTVDIIPGTDKSILSLIDHTDKMAAEATLKENERLMATILDNFPGIVYHCRYSDNWKIKFISPGCRALTGYDPKKFIGPLEDFYSVLVHPDDQGEVWGEIQNCLREKKSFGLTYRIIMLSGEERWVWGQGIENYSEAGEAISFEGFITDITDQKLSEMALAREYETLKTSLKGRYKLGAIIGISPVMQGVYEQIIRAAGNNANVVITGQSGTGKELVARAIHDLSDRRGKDFVPVNCGAIPENLLESEFFGYKKGAFTGANSDTYGFIEVANGGSLFLDELEALSTIMQVKLLRVIEGYGYTPVGGRNVIKSDIRIIAATNVDLQNHLDQGLMREDFYFRINVFPIRMPPLKERPQDIPLLIDSFLEKFSDKDNPLSIPATMREALKQYNWPGNVRELQNTIQRYAATGNFSFFTPFKQGNEKPSEISNAFSSTVDGGLQEKADAFEKQMILRVLEQNHWHRGETAAVLQIDRKTLLRKMKRYGIK